jgi:hypothetical protein
MTDIPFWEGVFRAVITIICWEGMNKMLNWLIQR